jgi:hypothetical protein
MGYNKGPLDLYLEFSGKPGWHWIGGNVIYSGDNYWFKYGADVGKFLNNTGHEPDKLWGWYKFLDGALHLQAAYVNDDWDYWRVGLIADDWSGNSAYAKHDGRGGIGRNFLLVDYSVSGFSIGFAMPNIFDTKGQPFVDDNLMHTVFGLKYSDGPINAAAQVALRGEDETGLYFSGSYAIDAITIGANFQSELEKDEDFYGNIGIDVFYGADLFNAGISAHIGIGGEDTYIGIFPKLFYKVTPTHLGFLLKAGFEFGGDDVGIMIQPQLI